MPEEAYWDTLLDVPLILDRLGIDAWLRNVVELGKGRRMRACLPASVRSATCTLALRDSAPSPGRAGRADRADRADVILEFRSWPVILAPLNLFNHVMAMMMLALWLPATSLCLVERAGWISNDNCCPSSSEEPQSSQPSGDSACCALASGSYKLGDQQGLTTNPPVGTAVILTRLAELASLPHASPAIARKPIPPELSVTWQFSFRTALPPRAPALVS